MPSTMERHEFQAEAKQLLDLMIHSVYSNKDIFLRELISNASDAIDKRRVASLSDDKIIFPENPRIFVEADESSRNLTISDDGIGMSRAEVVDYIGTLAKSGTKDFLAQLKESKDASASADLIGQFGIGFYSSFLVADKVTLLTRRADEETATLWESTGDGTYSVEESERETAGTTITLHLATADEDDGLGDYVKEWKIREIVKQYSDFVTYPIQMDVERTEFEKDDEGKPVEGGEEKKVITTETINSMKAIWTRSQSEVEQEEYNEFYKHLTHDWTDPLATLRFRAEGTFEYTMLLYLPTQAPFDLFQVDHKRGVHLYVKRIFIMDDCEDLVPEYLRFVRGVVDSEDLSLNISREILQQNRQITMMRSRLEKKILGALESMAKDESDKYQGWWKDFGKVLKEGLYRSEDDNRERIMKLALFESTHSTDDLTHISDYVDRMKSGQDKIYYATGENRVVTESSPHMEAYRDKGYEVLILTDTVDEVWSGTLPPKFADLEFESILKGAGELGTEEERKKASETLDEKKKEYSSLLERIQKELEEDIKEVRLSNRLTSSVACLVGDDQDMTPQMDQMMKAMGRDMGKQKRILELNPDHSVLRTLQTIFDANPDDERIGDYAELIHGQSVLSEGGKLSNPARFGQLITSLMEKAL